MKKYLCLLALLMPAFVMAAPSKPAQEVCDIIDGYIQGSHHYFDCLHYAEGLKSDLTNAQIIDSICSAIDTFNGLDESYEERCLRDARAALSQEALSCWPEHKVLYSQLPATFDAAAVSTFKTLAQTWKDAYKAKVQHANNSLMFDLQNEDGCLSGAYSVSLDGPNPLKEALKECVFTDINAYPGAAISPENREALASAFVEQNWGAFRFRKLINTSLKGDAIAAFNTQCVVEVRSSSFPGYKLYMAGYTHD